MKLPQDSDNELGREGFDWITLKVIAKVRKVRFGLFSHISLYESVVLKCCPNVLHHVASQRCCSQILMVLLSRSERTFVIYLGQYLRNGACCDQCLYETHIQSHIWSFSWPCDYLQRSNQGHKPSKGLCLINGASYEVCMKYIYQVIYGFSVYLITCITFDLWWNWKGKSRSLGFQWAIFHKLSTFWP